MFRFFEKFVHPYPDAEPGEPPKSLLAFVWHCTEGMRPYILVMTLSTAVIGAFEALLFAFLGRVVDWLAKVAPSQLWAEQNLPLDRKLYSKGGALYTKLITWMPVNDPTAGFVCYRNTVLETINLDEIMFVGYAFHIEMKFGTWKLVFKIKEIPITFVDRKVGVSKMSKGIIKEGVIGVLRVQWHSLFTNYRKRVKNVTPTVF